MGAFNLGKEASGHNKELPYKRQIVLNVRRRVDYGVVEYSEHHNATERSASETGPCTRTAITKLPPTADIQAHPPFVSAVR